MRLARLAERGSLDSQTGQFLRGELVEAIALQAVHGREDRCAVVGDAAGVVEQHPDGDGPPALARYEVG